MINAFDKWELAPGNRTRSVRTNEIAQTPLEVSIEGSRTLISHLPSALIINHQSVLNSHPTRRCQVCTRLSFANEGNPPPAHHFPGLYVLLKPFRAFVTVYEPSCPADSLIQNAIPLCTGAGVAPAPGCGASAGATGIAVCCSSMVFAMNRPGTVYS